VTEKSERRSDEVISLSASGGKYLLLEKDFSPRSAGIEMTVKERRHIDE
jgi:hypothetical protein